MKILNFLAAFLLFTLCTNGYCYNNNKTIYKEEATIPQDEIKIISTFTVTAKVARISGIFPNQYLKYTNQVTLTIAIYSNSVASVIAVGRVAAFQDDYTFECSDKQNDVIYCFNTSKLQ